MKAEPNHERRFIAAVDACDIAPRDLGTIVGRLNAWFAQLTTDLRADRLVCSGLKEQSPLAKQADAINSNLRAGMSAWSRQWTDLGAAQALADIFDGKAIFLVFGKFNSGKSSLSNFLADRFAAQGKAVEYFHLDAGRIVEGTERFKEGATETTARVQGVRLGGKLVLLDTPGLHSVTLENAALTRRFTDSADGVLWVTSSASPGQVQELDELSRELHRAKPLLPVLTRSDLYEEDEIEGELVNCLRNKTAQNRALQEGDVTARAEEKLAAMSVDMAQLIPPVSISVHMAREQGQSQTAMEEAGFERLYAALLAIAESALAYKQRKPAEILLHHLEENVLGTLHDQVLPSLAEFKASLQCALDRLENQREQMISAVWRSVVPILPDLLDKHCADVKAVCSGLSQALSSASVVAERQHLADYTLVQDEALAGIDLEENAGVRDLTVEAGGMREIVGVDYERLYMELSKQIHSRLLRHADVMIEQCRVSISGMMENVACMEAIVLAHEDGLLGLKAELRTLPT
ncbi:GTPase [Azospirillum endophyticum]